jgi:TPP-dependent pyruvate/acetoin dehydrogenase alpha subunit
MVLLRWQLVGRCIQLSPPRFAVGPQPRYTTRTQDDGGASGEGDPSAYREAIAADEWQQKDPILRLQRQALAAGWIDEAGAAAVEREAVAAAERFATASPFPPADLPARMVYAGAPVP